MSEKMPSGLGRPESKEASKSTVQRAIEAYVVAEDKNDTEVMEKEFQRVCKAFRNYEKGKFNQADIDAAFAAFAPRGKGEDVERAIMSNFTIEKRNGREIIAVADQKVTYEEEPNTFSYYRFGDIPTTDRQRYLVNVSKGSNLWRLLLSRKTDREGNDLDPEKAGYLTENSPVVVIEQHQKARLMQLGGEE